MTTTSLTGIVSSQTSEAISLKNRSTGKVIHISLDKVSKRSYKFQKSCRAIQQMCADKGLTMYFVTFTLKSSSYGTITKEFSRMLDFFRHRLDRAGYEYVYLWAVELQKKRYAKTGRMYRHWHLAVGVEDGLLPDVEYLPDNPKHYNVKQEGTLITVRDLVGVWGEGQVFSCKAYESLAGYLGKYMDKNEEFLDYKQKMYGSSKIDSHYRYPAWVRDEMEGAEGRGVDFEPLVVKYSPGTLRAFEWRMTADYFVYRKRRRGKAGRKGEGRDFIALPSVPDLGRLGEVRLVNGLAVYQYRVYYAETPWVNQSKVKRGGGLLGKLIGDV